MAVTSSASPNAPITGMGRTPHFVPDRSEPAHRTTSFNVSAWLSAGTWSATVQVERSFDGGTTWCPLTAAGSSLAFTGAFSETYDEPERDVIYCLNCTSYTSGTIQWRFSN